MIEKYDADFFTEYGGLKTRRDDEGENQIYFLALLEKWRELNGKDLLPKTTDYTLNIWNNYSETGIFTDSFDSTHFSLDDMLGFYYLFGGILIGYERLPTFYWNGKGHYHPNTWAVHLTIKYKFFNFFFYPLIGLMAMWSANMSDSGDTSGTLLWWLRLQMLSYDKTFKRFEEVKKQQQEIGYIYSFKYYFTRGFDWQGNMDHPVLIEMKEYYSET